MNHTPGPWKFNGQQDQDEFWFQDGFWEIRIGPGRGYCVPVGIGGSVNPDKREADARLIAAAPELLEALKECVRIIEEADTSLGVPDLAREKMAILKAEGAMTFVPVSAPREDARLAAALDVLRQVEYVRGTQWGQAEDCCPACGAHEDYEHQPDCKIAAALNG